MNILTECYENFVLVVLVYLTLALKRGYLKALLCSRSSFCQRCLSVDCFNAKKIEH